ncbi:MAG: H-NS histone family protein [Betaproteobacteria bacterium]|nr:H-NS histone family protein [Betaproteobacteria bacterium]
MDLSNLTVAQLRDLQQQIPAEIKRRQNKEKQNAVKELRAAAKALGFDLEDLVGSGAPKGKAKSAGTKVKVKYRHPKDASLAWTGRGRQPKWVVEYLAKGGKIEALAV